MTTLSLKVTLDDQDAKVFEQLSEAFGDAPDQLAAEVIQWWVRWATRSYVVNMDLETFSQWQERLRPYREAGPYESEEAFLNR